jgi:predicted 2-oxoglutarate/Fe(II)-dependent dioxygenase YbiX
MYITPQPIPATKILGGSIAIWENAWIEPNETIKALEKNIKESSNLDWRKATTIAEESGVEHSTQRTNSIFHLRQNARDNEALRKISNDYFDLVASATEWYAQNFGMEEHIYFPEEFNVLRYQTGEEYHAHYDGGTASKRAISPILYLNDDYTGGEIEFVNYDIKIKPKAGMFLIFPANFAFRHVAHPVKTGTKYAIVTWLHDQP